MINGESASRRAFMRESMVGVTALAASSVASARPPRQEPSAADRMIGKGVEFLRGRQAADGSWTPGEREPGVTAIAITALLRSKRLTAAEPPVAKGLQFLEQFVGEDGGLSKAPHANYSTAIAMLAFKEANAAGRFDSLLKSGRAFLIEKQWDEGEQKTPMDPFYGGAGYGGANSRPDLSNTAFMIEALRDTGLPANDPALQKALLFISRCQNLKSEFNDQPWADKVNDGGFIYTAAQGGSSVAGKTDDGGLRSYASMTYAGLKSMIYAGLAKDDPRVKAATKYIRSHYTLEENPGLGDSGLYYYYHTFAKTMALLGEDAFTDQSGTEHDWRAELQAALAKRQKPGGEWVGASDRFMEGNPDLVTAYAVIALAYCRKPAIRAAQ
jgi:squalene-hopene/tetraprenyl-beta-curcumene cyclase